MCTIGRNADWNSSYQSPRALRNTLPSTTSRSNTPTVKELLVQLSCLRLLLDGLMLTAPSLQNPSSNGLRQGSHSSAWSTPETKMATPMRRQVQLECRNMPSQWSLRRAITRRGWLRVTLRRRTRSLEEVKGDEHARGSHTFSVS